MLPEYNGPVRREGTHLFHWKIPDGRVWRKPKMPSQALLLRGEQDDQVGQVLVEGQYERQSLALGRANSDLRQAPGSQRLALDAAQLGHGLHRWRHRGTAGGAALRITSRITTPGRLTLRSPGVLLSTTSASPQPYVTASIVTVSCPRVRRIGVRAYLDWADAPIGTYWNDLKRIYAAEIEQADEE